MTKKSARNDIFGLVMLSEAKHPCNGFLACARNDKKERAERHRPCHAERSEASMSGFLADARNDKKERSE